jgi:hypothetical protein
VADRIGIYAINRRPRSEWSPPLGSLLRCHMAPFYGIRGADLFVVHVADYTITLSANREALPCITYRIHFSSEGECEFETLLTPDQVLPVRAET